MGINPYPAALFPVDATSVGISNNYKEGKKVIIAGRLMSRRIRAKLPSQNYRIVKDVFKSILTGMKFVREMIRPNTMRYIRNYWILATSLV
jgi:hypothetical protein